MKKLNKLLKVSPLILLTTIIPLGTLISCNSFGNGTIDVNIKSKESPIISFTESRSTSIELTTVQKVFDGITSDNFKNIKVSWETQPASTAVMVLTLNDKSVIKSNVIKITLSEIKAKQSENITQKELDNPQMRIEFLQKLFDGINQQNFLFFSGFKYTDVSLGKKTVTLTAKDNWTFDGKTNKITSMPFLPTKEVAGKITLIDNPLINYNELKTLPHRMQDITVLSKVFNGINESNINQLSVSLIGKGPDQFQVNLEFGAAGYPQNNIEAWGSLKSNKITAMLSSVTRKTKTQPITVVEMTPAIPTIHTAKKLFSGLTTNVIKLINISYVKDVVQGYKIIITGKDGWTFDGVNNKLESSYFKVVTTNILTREIVLDNYSKNGSWIDDFSLTADHLRGYTEIGDKAFYLLYDILPSRLRNLEIPNTVTRIGVSSFASYSPWHSNNLEVVTFEEGSVLKEIDNSAFYSADNLRIINFPSTLNRIGVLAFAMCQKLVSTFPPNSQLKTIDVEAFASNQRMTQLDLPEGLEFIGTEAFSGNLSIENIYIPKSVTRIGGKPFFHTLFAPFDIIRIPKMYESRTDKLGFYDDAWLKIVWY